MTHDVIIRTSDVPTRETVRFAASRIPLGAEILEIGCGEGQVAFELLSRGYRLTGLDSDPELITRAGSSRFCGIVARVRQRSCRCCRLYSFIASYQPATWSARQSARADSVHGITSYFAFGEANETTIAWFLEVLSKQGLALINPVAGQLVTDLLTSKDPMAVWHRNHDQGLHSMTAMSWAVEERFITRETELVPYLYRYLVPVVAETPEAAAFVEEVLQEEARLGKQGDAALIGRRIVASPGTD